MLEKYFLKPSTVDRIRAHWLAPQIERYVEWMQAQGYADRSIIRRVPYLCHFADFTSRRGTIDLSSAVALVEEFASYWVARDRTSAGSKPPRPGLLDEVRNPIRQMLCLALEGRIKASRQQKPYLSLPKMPSGANAFEISDIQEDEAAAVVVTEYSVRSENTRVPIIREIMVATTMSSLFVAFFTLLVSTFRTRAALHAEILALRHQLAVFQKTAPRRLRLHRCDRLLWVVLYRFWSGWRRCLQMVKPDTVVRWHRRAFAWHWTRTSRRLPGRPEVAANIRDLIQRMSQANPLWGAPRIHGELLKLGIAVAQSTVARYLSRSCKPPSQTWRTFLTNHLAQTAAIDFFTVPTATFRVLFVFVVLSHERRRVVHFGVTEHPTQEWTMQQMREAFPWDQVPRYVLRDRDAIYGTDFAAMTRDLGMEEVLTAPRSPWQNPFAERLVGSIRRECLDHVIVWNERSLRRTLHNYFAYYQRSRTHLALGKDAPESRAVEPPEQGRVVAIAQVGGLHHRYQRRAA